MRDGKLDAARGVAFVLMLVHHLAFFGLLAEGKPLIVSAPVSVCGSVARNAFIVIAGVALAQQMRANAASSSSSSSGSNGSKRRGFLRSRLSRCVTIAAHAAVVSIVTRLAVPAAWVRFGILHFMCVALAVTAVLLSAPTWLAILGALALLLAPRTGVYIVDLVTGAAPPPVAMIDWFPLNKWLGPLWVGLALGAAIPNGPKGPEGPEGPEGPKGPRGMDAALQFLGRNSLELYTLHYAVLCAWVGLNQKGT